jgi:biopolymer transport protein ExbB
MFEALTAMAEHGDVAVVWLLIALSLIGLAVFFERMVLYHSQSANLPELKTRLLKAAHSDEALGEVQQEFEKMPSTPARLCAVSLACRNRSPEATQEVTDSLAIEERQRLERGVNFLGTVGANAPFIGLFGTVLGIVKAFHDLSIATTAGPQVVMAGISKALIATAVGLMVAIPAVVAYNYFKGRIKKILAASDVLVKLALSYQIDRYLSDPGTGCMASLPVESETSGTEPTKRRAEARV